MRKGLLSVLLATAILLGAVGEGGAAQCTLPASVSCAFPNLVSSLGAVVSPRTLPANEYVPVKWGVFGKVSTRDGTHPSALREVELGVDRDVRINSRDYPVCEGFVRAMTVLDTKAAAKACPEALIGRGRALIELAFPEREPIPVSSQLLVFNGGEEDGVTKLLIHAFVPVPRPTAIIAVVEVARKGAGLRTISKIPVIAGGSGSLLDFEFEVGKAYSHRGTKLGYFEAKCPDGVFKATVGKLLLRNEAKIPGVAAQTVMKGGLAVPCTTQG